MTVSIPPSIHCQDAKCAYAISRVPHLLRQPKLLFRCAPARYDPRHSRPIASLEVFLIGKKVLAWPNNVRFTQVRIARLASARMADTPEFTALRIEVVWWGAVSVDSGLRLKAESVRIQKISRIGQPSPTAGEFA